MLATPFDTRPDGPSGPLSNEPSHAWSAYSDLEEAADANSRMDKIEKGLATSHHMRNRWHLTEMSYIVEATRHKVYLDYGYESTSQWLSATMGVGYWKACETVDIALMLEDLVHIRHAFARGLISYDHLRALVRVATTENEQELLALTNGKSVSETFRIVKRLTILQEREPQAKHGFVETRWDKELGTLNVYGELPHEQGAIFKQTLDELARSIPEIPDENGEPTPIAVKRAAALCELVGSSVSSSRSQPLVMVHVEAGQLCEMQTTAGTASTVPDAQAPEIAGGCLVNPSVARRLLCDSIVQLVIDDEHGAPLGFGRRRRTINSRLRIGLEKRDVTCRWPGCRHYRNLEAHHIVPWAQGGATDYDNLVLLCHIHHIAIEHGGFKIRGKPPNITIEASDGRSIANGPPHQPKR